MKYWLVKTEPDTYSWDQFVKDKKTSWDGVRNYQARNNLKEMKKGDQVLWYHSNTGKEITGIAKVSKEFYQDPSTNDSNWVSVELALFKKLRTPVSLAQIKSDKRFKNLLLVKNGRLSVMPVSAEEFNAILELALTKI